VAGTYRDRFTPREHEAREHEACVIASRRASTTREHEAREHETRVIASRRHFKSALSLQMVISSRHVSTRRV